jgi:hypothetical protein
VRVTRARARKEVRQMNRKTLFLLFAVCAAYAPLLAACEICVK